MTPLLAIGVIERRMALKAEAVIAPERGSINPAGLAAEASAIHRQTSQQDRESNKRCRAPTCPLFGLPS
jgi:hypothetical protein